LAKQEGQKSNIKKKEKSKLQPNRGTALEEGKRLDSRKSHTLTRKGGERQVQDMKAAKKK